MSLLTPNIIERVVASAKSFTQWRLVAILAAILVAVGLFLWLVAYQQSCSFNRGVTADKQAINAQLSNIADRQKVIANLNEQVAIEKQAVNVAVKELANASTATETAKAETNQAIANLEKAKDANTSGTSADELRRLLDQLDK